MTIRHELKVDRNQLDIEKLAVNLRIYLSQAANLFIEKHNLTDFAMSK